MTLLISCMLIAHMELPIYWFVIIFCVWVLHLNWSKA